MVRPLLPLLHQESATRQLLPASVREDPRTFEVSLPDHSGLALQAFACVPDLMVTQLVLDNVQMQQRCVEFMWLCVQKSTGSLPAATAHSRRRLVEVLATSMEDPDDDAELFDDDVATDGGSTLRAGSNGRQRGVGRRDVWCSSHDMVVSCLSLLLVLRLGLGPGSAEGAAGVGVGEARLLSRALLISRRMLETREGKRVFLLYRAMPVVSMLLRSRNRAVRAPAATIVLSLSAEGDHLPALFAACANEEWIRSCAIALTYAIRGVGSSQGGGMSARAPTPAQPSDRGLHAEDAEDAHVQECLCVLLQRMSAKPAYRSLFRVANLHGILLDSAHSAAHDKNRCVYNKVVLVHVLLEITANVDEQPKGSTLAIDCAHSLLDPLLCPLGNFSTRTSNCYLRHFDDIQVVLTKSYDRWILERRRHSFIDVQLVDVARQPTTS